MSNDLSRAHELAAAGVPIFTATPNRSFDPLVTDRSDPRAKEFYLPRAWQESTPLASLTPTQGDALCAVTGHVLDTVDVDTKNGASVEAERHRLHACGVAIVGESRTPSIGAHFYVLATGICSSSKPVNGVDFRGGAANGTGRGFVYLPGTLRPKYDNAGYAWIQEVDLDILAELDQDEQRDAIWTYLQGRGIEPRLTAGVPAQQVAGEPVDDADLPADLAERLGTLSVEDRSEYFYGTVGLCKRHGYTQGQAVTLLTPWCTAVGKYVARVAGEVARAWPRLSEPSRGSHDVVRTSSETGPAELEKGKFSSVPMGRKLARERLAGNVMYVTNVGWHMWDGTRWESVHEDRIMAIAADWAEDEFVSLVRSRNQDVDDKVMRAVLKYREVGNVRQLLAGARTEPNILVDACDLDAHEALLNCANGVLDLRTGHLGPHDPTLRLTKTTGIAYVPDATHDDWGIKALAALPDTDTVAYLQRYLGAAATGERDRGGPILFQQGDGANGKTTVMETVMHALGEYAVQLPDKLLGGQGNEHDTQWMTLQGARLACVEELPEGHQLPVAKIKKLADTSTITGRLIGRDYVTFPATHSLIVNTNYRPRVTETDHGTWRRNVMIEYGHTFSGPTKDNTLKRRLRQRAQAEAVLAWIAEGARAWYANDRDLGALPDAVAQSTAEWRADSDPLAVFITEALTFTSDDTDRITTAELLERFNQSLPFGTKPWSSTLFSSRLRAHHIIKEAGAKVDRGHRGRERTGLTRVVWNQGAQGAQGHFRGFELTKSREKLRVNPVHPVHPNENGDFSETQEAPKTADRPPNVDLADRKKFDPADCGECGWPTDSRAHTVDCATARLQEVSA